ncbi:MAG TPA: POTRA domain-containing protein [Pyrinomonadaceae bacterium]|nr:POTRA domain-containing protein [Pyrinomonadaceae bacterium]
MRLRNFVLNILWLAAFLIAAGGCVSAAHSAAPPDVGDYDGRVVSAVEVVIEGSPPDAAAQAEFASILTIRAGEEYQAVRARESLKALFDSGMVASARVEVFEAAGGAASTARGGPIRVRFVVRRATRVSEVVLDLGVVPPGAPVSEDEMRARLNMLEPGARLSESTIRTNADLIQAYLRDRGFVRAEVEAQTQPDTRDQTGTRVILTFQIRLNEQARVNAPQFDVQNFDIAPVLPTLKLQQNAPFTRQALADDVNRIRQAIIAKDFLAPQVDARTIYNQQTNRFDISYKVRTGPYVNVLVRGYELSDKRQRELLPIRREGTLDFGAITEGERRLRNRIQEAGYFFAQVTPVCTVTPPTPATTPNSTPDTCQNLNPEELSGRNVQVIYDVELGRRFKLTDVRLTGTDKLTIEEIQTELRTKKASALGFIPLLGYGRGYTSRELLAQDERLIEARMRDLGYRRAEVEVRQAASLDGENLIITFVVREGPLTRVAGVEVRGNKIYTEAQVRDQLQWTILDGPFSRSASRADADRIASLYATEGYINVQVDFSIVELPRKIISDQVYEEQVKVVYTITREGDKVFIASIRVNGNVLTKKEAILNAIPLFENEVLRLDKLTESERILYQTDAFRQVIITTEPAGETASGFKKYDVIIDVEELKPRIREYGGGYSTDNGPLGFFDIRNVNLFGQLKQGAARARFSRRQQLLRLEYFDPRFRRYGDNQFMPLAISAQYQRDSSITRFFRSRIDRGNQGIVQRLDEEGNPINEFGERVGEPTINRFTFNLETQRVLDRDTRSIIFVRYNYEDVRLYNIESLLLQPILQPDRAIRLSRFGAAFVRDTREKCDANNSRLLQQNRQPGAPTRERCEYSATDATNGDFLTVDYSLALKQLGSSLSFNKFYGNYRRYYRVQKARGTVLAGSITLGLANVFNPSDRNNDGVIDDTDRTLPISERFFSGGSTTLRGFGYEEAGPRETIVPVGQFRNREGEPVEINPFLVPTGGNAVAVVNLEARIPIVNSFQIVPFYDGGNVFRFVSELFGRKATEESFLSEAERIRRLNLRANWTNTVGLGIRIRTPIGGALAVDYGFFLDPPEFLVPQAPGFAPVITRLKNGQLHFRFTQTF